MLVRRRASGEDGPPTAPVTFHFGFMRGVVVGPIGHLSFTVIVDGEGISLLTTKTPFYQGVLQILLLHRDAGGRVLILPHDRIEFYQCRPLVKGTATTIHCGDPCLNNDEASENSEGSL